MVLPPRRSSPACQLMRSARSNASRSTPGCSQNRASSARRIASMTFGETSSGAGADAAPSDRERPPRSAVDRGSPRQALSGLDGDDLADASVVEPESDTARRNRVRATPVGGGPDGDLEGRRRAPKGPGLRGGRGRLAIAPGDQLGGRPRSSTSRPDCSRVGAPYTRTAWRQRSSRKPSTTCRSRAIHPDDGEDRDSGPPQRAPRHCPRRLHRPILPPPLTAREERNP